MLHEAEAQSLKIFTFCQPKGTLDIMQYIGGLGGRTRRVPPPKGPNSFILTYKFYEA